MPYEAGRVAIGNLIPGGTPGSVLFVGAAGELAQDNANFQYDNTNNRLLLAPGSTTFPSYAFTNDGNTGPYRAAAGVLGISVNGLDAFRFSAVGGANGLITIRHNAVGSNGGFAIGAAAASPDVILARDAANTFAQRNGTNAQTHRIYNTFTDASNYERGKLEWSGNIFQVGPESAGTGSPRSMRLVTGGNITIQINGTDRWIWTNASNGDFLASTDNTTDIGASGASRPQTIYVGTSVQIEANNGLKFTNAVDGAAAGAGTLANAPAAGDPTFWLPVTVNGANKHIPCW